MPILFPPHPENKILPQRLGDYEKSGNWIAQRKFNGTHVLLHISTDRKVTILTRHGTTPKLFNLTKSHIDQILSLNLEPEKEYWLNGELLDHKTKNKNYKNKIILFDILQAGEYLIMKMNQKDRLDLLAKICRNPTELEPNSGIALQATPDIWLAENFSNEFEKHFEEFIHLDEIEGLVLRKKNSFIDNYGQREYSVNWIIRCRKPHSGGSYNF